MAKLRHIALIVPDPEKAAKFFEDAFDMKVAGKARRGLYVAEKIGFALVGILFPPLFSLILTLMGIHLGVVIPAAASLALAVRRPLDRCTATTMLSGWSVRRRFRPCQESARSSKASSPRDDRG